MFVEEKNETKDNKKSRAYTFFFAVEAEVYNPALTTKISNKCGSKN